MVEKLSMFPRADRLVLLCTPRRSTGRDARSMTHKECEMTTGQTHGQLWSGGARDWARYIEPQNYPLYEAVQERLGIGAGTRLLDVGCGPGGAASLAARRGAQVAGLDASPGSIEVARERVPTGDFRVGDMETLTWLDGSFEVVTYFNSLQFAGNPTAALREARRVLGTGGKVGIAVWAPREQSQQPKIMAATSTLAPPQPPDAPGPFALSEPNQLESVLDGAELRVVSRGEVPIVVEYPDAETAVRAAMSSGGTTRAVQHSGEERVRQALLEAIQEFRGEGGEIRLHNRFRFVIVE